MWEKYVLGGKRSSRCSHLATLRWHRGKPGSAGAYRLLEAVADAVACPLAVERLRGASLTPSGSLLHEVRVLLGEAWVYSTVFGVSCSTDNPRPVGSEPRGVDVGT